MTDVNTAWLRVVRLETVDSTNNYLKSLPQTSPHRPTLVTTEFQTAGRGSYQNTWESASGQNLLFSLAAYPTDLQAKQMFVISEVTALALHATLSRYLEGVKVKWPNDIYVGDRKIVGMLIENDLAGKMVSRTVIGVGLNVNQTEFVSDAPNPVSMAQVLGHEVDREEVLDMLLEEFRLNYDAMEAGGLDCLHQRYLSTLYRWEQWYDYKDEDGIFRARITDVEPSGHLVLETEDGIHRRYAFKEVSFII